MVSLGVFLDVMKIVRFHHRGCLDTFAFDRYQLMCRVRYLVALNDFQVRGVIDADGRQDPNFVAGEVSDLEMGIRRLAPGLLKVGPISLYTLCYDAKRGFDAAYWKMRQDDESHVVFCENAFQVLRIEDGFVLPRFHRRCEVGRYEWEASTCGLLYMRDRNLYESYLEWAATMR